jgi:hypothetical protein
VVLARCQTSTTGGHRWKVRFDTSLRPTSRWPCGWTISTNQAALDYYLLPRLDFGQSRIQLG